MVCSISNPDFVIYSSVVSFYLPFIITLLVYVRIYIFLRMRRKRIAFGQASGKVRPGSAPPSAVSDCHLIVLQTQIVTPSFYVHPQRYRRQLPSQKANRCIKTLRSHQSS